MGVYTTRNNVVDIRYTNLSFVEFDSVSTLENQEGNVVDVNLDLGQ